MIVLHAHGFVEERGVRGISVSSQEAEHVIDVARPTIERATSRKSTELVSFQRTWPLDGYGAEWAVCEVNAVTRTTLDCGDTWHEMWHWFGTASIPWPLAETNEPTRAPVQKSSRKLPGGTISWAEHEAAWLGYQRRFPGSAAGQNARRIAERGGFGRNELIEFLGREPETFQQYEAKKGNQ